MKLYFSPGACSMATHILLEWIGKPYATEKVEIHDPKSPSLLKVNPLGAVPVIEDNGMVLTQNAGIMNYLAALHPEAKLMGDGSPKAVGEVNHWLGLLNSDLHPAFKPMFGATAYIGDEKAIAKTQENAKRTVHKLLERINTDMNTNGWLTGYRSMADAYLFVMLGWCDFLKWEHADLANLQKLVQNMRADAGVQAVMKKEHG